MQLWPMAASDNGCPTEPDGEKDTDAFDVKASITVINKHLKLNVTVKHDFLREVDGRTFALLDFYQSRGVCAVMASRLPLASCVRKSYSTLLAKVAAELRGLRDAAFQQAVLTDVNEPGITYGRSITNPRHKKLKVAVLAKSDVVSFALPGTNDGDNGDAIVYAVVPIDRKNRNNELWMEATGPTFDSISKFTRAKYDSSTDAERVDESEKEVATMPCTPYKDVRTETPSREDVVTLPASGSADCLEASTLVPQMAISSQEMATPSPVVMPKRQTRLTTFFKQ